MADEDLSDYELNGIREQDFQIWKHHPVTKVYQRFLLDYERQMAEKQIAVLRTVTQTPDAFTLGTFNGQINAVAMVTALEFSDLVAFYGTEEEQEEPDAA